MKKGWMVRAAEGGRLFEDFEKGYVAIGWKRVPDLADYDTPTKVVDLYNSIMSEQKQTKAANARAIVSKFRCEVQHGDIVVTYDPASREYLLGEISGDYEYKPDFVGDYPHTRSVNWKGKVSRDKLKTKTRNSLGSTLAMFSLKDHVLEDMLNVLEGRVTEAAAVYDDQNQREDIEDVEDSVDKEDTINKSRELIKDKLVELDDEEMEQLVAAVLRGMGFRAQVMPKGPDRGVDIFASPDGLGLQEPRIKAEVKHRAGSMGSQALRSFISVLRPGDRGVYVSSGGFSREARYEAERATIPVKLVDIDDLAGLVVEYYEDFDMEGKAMIPLVKIYWPAE